MFLDLTVNHVSQGSAKTKEDAEKAFTETQNLDSEVSDMMDQLSAAEQELVRKRADADNDMMMATMVQMNQHLPFNKFENER